MVVDSEKTASSRYSQMDAHMSTQRQWQYTQDLRSFKSSKILAWRRRSGHTVLPLSKKLFAIDTNPLRKGKPVFYHEVVLGIAFLFCLFCIIILFCYFLFWFGGSLWLFLGLFLFLREEKGRIEVGWVGRIWEKIGEGEGLDQNLLNENVFNKKIN